MAKNEPDDNKEILKKLYEILLNQYTEKPESRTLIFVATRVCAQRLSEHLSNYLSKFSDLRMFSDKKGTVGYMTSMFYFLHYRPLRFKSKCQRWRSI